MPGLVVLLSYNTAFFSFGKFLPVIYRLSNKHSPLPNLWTIQRLQQIFS